MEIINETRVAFLTEFIKEIVPQSELTQVTSCSTSSADEKNKNSYLMELAHKHTTATFEDNSHEYIQKECLKYLVSCDANDLVDGNVIKYWKDRRTAFPLLYKLAKAVLSAPATSTPSERVFSVAGLTVTAKRSRLNSSRVDKIIFVHDN